MGAVVPTAGQQQLFSNPGEHPQGGGGWGLNNTVKRKYGGGIWRKRTNNKGAGMCTKTKWGQQGKFFLKKKKKGTKNGQNNKKTCARVDSLHQGWGEARETSKK